MAALLKKRALAEFSQVIQEEPKPVQKKLRLIHKAKSPEPQLEIQSTTSSYDAFQSLLRFQECLPISTDYLETTLRSLLDHYKKEKEAFVRAKIASLLGDLAKTPGFNSSLLVDEILNMVSDEKSHKTLSQLIGTLIVIGRSRPQDTNLHQQLIAVAKENLTDSSHCVRCKSLELIGALGSPDQKKTDGGTPDRTADRTPDRTADRTADRSVQSGATAEKSLQTILGEHAHDIDPRVRSSSFEAMLRWHERGLKLNSSLYSEVCAALTDDYEGVRLAAVKLVWVLSQLYPDTMVPSEDQQEQIRMIDDGFARICHMVNDLTVRVRAEAVGLLGSLHLVSPRFLEQTLDKKLMSNMRRKKSSHERQKDHYLSGEWSTGQKWADDKPKEEVDPDSATLISSGACGAFVHGLEDEYMEVRNAAIDSLCELAKQSASFANLSQDYLVDMFNDEIEAVRLNAINSLQKISNHIILREDQLEIILGVLKDFSSEIREALHAMLSSTKLGTKGCLNDSVIALLDNIRRYPQDRMSVWKCMCDLGSHHPSLVLPLASDFLNNHPYFDTPEPDMDDPCYTAVLLMVLNATPTCPTLPTLYLDHTIRHYTYLRDSVPHLVPDIRLPGVSSQVRSMDESGEGAGSFMSQILDRLTNLGSMDSGAARQLMEITIRDFGRIQELVPTDAASAVCHSMYMECQVALLKLLTGHQWSSAVIVSSQQKSQSLSLINKVLELSEHMECLFVGLSTADVAAIRQVRLRAHTLQLLTKLQSNASEARSACIQYLRTISQLQRLLNSHELTADAFTAAVLSSMHRLESCEPAIFLSVLQAVLDKHRPAYLHLSTKVQQASATIEETVSPDTAVKFTAGLTASIPLHANLENVKNTQSIRIQVKYPDQQTELIVPRVAHFRQLSPLRHRLVTNVRLSHATWSEACYVELSLVMCYNPDRDIQSDKPEHSRLDHSSCSSTLQLCKPVKILASPKPPKR